MINLNKRGQQTNKVVVITLVIFVLMAVAIGVMTFRDGSFSSLSGNTDTVISAVGDTVVVIMSSLLGVSQGDQFTFLIIITFILFAIIVVGVLDTVNIFGEGTSSNWYNFIIGVVVAIIGVRFMPPGLWASLTAPSSAFVATLLVGLPFFATVFVTMRIKSFLVSKLLWLFYLVMTISLVLKYAGEFSYIYLIFLVLAAIMLAMDSTVKKFFAEERIKSAVVDAKSTVALKEIAILQKELKEWESFKKEYKIGTQERKDAEKEVQRIQKEIAAYAKERAN
jgi:hypothetical protein